MKKLLHNFVLNGILIIVLLLSNYVTINAEFSGKLSGVVIDSETNKSVANAVVQVLGTNFFTTSDANGFFSFGSLTEGEYTLKTTHVAYRENLVKIKFDEFSQTNFIVYLIPKAIEISTIIVSDISRVSKFEDLYELSNVLKGKQLQKDLGQTLASTLKNETGLAIRSMGPAPARPVIRGLGGDRVFISEDDVKTNDISATSPDHAVTIEPFSVERIEVLRGPKVLTKTPVTIGGIVNVVRNEIPKQIHNAVFGTVGFGTETANRGYVGLLSAEIPYSPFAARLELSRRKTFDISTPIGKLGNSYSENINYSFGAGYVQSFGNFGFSYRHYELDYGVPGGFIGAHPNGVDIKLYRNQLNFQGDLVIDSYLFENISIKYNHSYYRHKEFEKSGKIGSEFRIINHLANVNLHHKKIGILENGIIGLSFEASDFDIGGFVFTSPTKSFNLSTFLYESLSFGKFSLETAVRYNYDRISPIKEKPNANIGNVRQRIFNTYSLSLSALYQLTDIVYIGSNISKSSRVPKIEELFSEGPHLAAYSYEVGNPNLDAESGIGTEIFIYHKFEKLFFNLNFFRNDLSNYIIPRSTGEINYSTFLPVFATQGLQAIMYGIEFQADWGITNHFSLETSFNYTRGKLRFSNKSLPQIPPFKGLLGVKFETELLNFGVNSEFALAQKKVDIFEEPTAGYVIFNSYAQYSFNGSDLLHTISLNIDNIFNKEYRNHLSRVKSIMPEAGVNARLTYKLFFHM